MGFAHEFLDFVKKHQVVGLAVAFVIGSAATKMVTATVNDIVMPILGVVLPNGDWRAAILQLGPVKLLIGDFAGSLIDFLVVAFVVFLAVKFFMDEDAIKKK